MLCQRLKSCMSNIYLQRGQCSFLALFVWVCVVLFFVVVFLFSTCSFLACCLGFHFFFVYVNISLQQSTCIVFISHVVGFALSCCYLLDHFLHFCLGFRFFSFFKHFFATIHLFFENG